MLERIRGFINYYKVFSSLSDIYRFRKVAYQNGTDAVVVNVREAGSVPMWIRPHTSDAAVLWDSFYDKYHLPPARLKSDAMILDLGANVGYTAAHFAYLYPNATIVAVELDIENFKAAKKNLEGLDQCRLIHAAVWSEDGYVHYDRNEEEWGFHVNIAVQSSSVGSAPAKTIETLIEENGIREVDYLKMDIEGAEANVLSGGRDWFEKVKMMKIELHPKFNKDANYENCSKILLSRGFQCSRDRKHWNTLIAIKG